MKNALSFLKTLPALASLKSAMQTDPSRAFCTSAICLAFSPGLSLSKAKILFCRAGKSLILCSRLCLLNIIDWRKPLFPRLQAQQDVARLSRSSVPPSAKEMRWSTSRTALGALWPQYWQVNWSRANTSHRSLYHPLRSLAFFIGTMLTHWKRSVNHSQEMLSVLLLQWV